MKMSSLLTLVEGAQGYNGGNYVDEMPHLSLTECMGGLNVALLNAQIELHESAMAQNDALVEAAVSAIQSGSSADFSNLVEMSFADIKAKVKKIFDSIIKFLKSIIDKLKVQINKIRMTGSALYAKYKDSNLITKKDFSKMTFNGYKFKDAGNLFKGASTYEENVEALIVKVGGGKYVVPSKFAEAYKAGEKWKETEKAGSEQAQKIIDGLKDISKGARQLAMAKELTGASKLTEGSWESDLKNELYGEKVEMKYGSDFTLDSVAALLKEPANLNLILDEYIKLGRAVNSYRDELQRELDKVDAASGSSNTEKANTSISLVSAYYNAYMSLISDSYGVINRVKSIKYNFEKARLDQAKTIFGKMLTYKAAKEDADEVFADGEDFDFDL